ncbi:MAG: hypothetical protein RR603_02950, partial [Kurthia sp.]
MATSKSTTRKTPAKKTTPIKRKTTTASKRKPSTANKKPLSPLVYEIIGLVLIAISIFTFFKLGVV